MSLKLHTVIASTRPGRIGPGIAKWFNDYVGEHGKFEPKLVDLADFNLPLLDEPAHPRMQQYTKDHTKAWSKSVQSADAFVFVTPEYNYGPPPSLVNALNYLVLEWNYAPVGIVSYGGVSGGLRSAQAIKPLVGALKMMAIPEGVPLPMVFAHLDEQKNFKAEEIHRTSAKAMLDEMHRWAEALQPLRAQIKAPVSAKAAA
jgi:NAD(P)H-dependent FMN reductase